MVDTKNMIFVFGSNTGGIHGAGAAKAARVEHGAVWGQGFGLQGRSFAIPTKGIITYGPNVSRANPRVGDTLPLWAIKDYVDAFIIFADQHPELQFQVTRIGCGLAGLKDSEIAPMFIECDKYRHPNIWFDNVWMHEFAFTGRMSMAGYNIWGTY